MPQMKLGVCWSASVIDETGFGVTKTKGLLYSFAREDHSHGTPSAATTISDCTSAIAAATGGSGSTVARGDHFHRAPGAFSVITSIGAQCNNSATQQALITASLPASYYTAGTTFRIRAHGAQISTASQQMTYAICLSNGALGANTLCSVIDGATTAARQWEISGMVTLQTATAAMAQMALRRTTTTVGTPYVVMATATLAVDCSAASAAHYLELCCTCGNATTGATVNTFDAVIEAVKL